MLKFWVKADSKLRLFTIDAPYDAGEVELCKVQIHETLAEIGCQAWGPILVEIPFNQMVE